MKNTQHTPCPWQIDYSGTCHIGITDKNDRTIAFCALQNEDGDEDEANARLISAAPDLLSAARNAANVLAALATGQLAAIHPDSNALQELRAAIAKAKGEA